MIKKLNNSFSHFKSFTGKYDIFFIVSILVVFVFFNTLKTYEGYGFYDYVYLTIADGVGVVIFFSMFTYINNRILKNLNNSCEILPRFESKTKYFQHTINKMLKTNLFIYTTFLLFTLFILVFKSDSLGKSYYVYNIPSYVYIIFFIIRYFSIIFILSIISVFIYRTFKNNIFLTIPLIIISLPNFFPVIMNDKVNSILEMKLLYFHYIEYIKYSSFPLEVSLSFLYILLLVGVLLMIINFSIKRSIGD